ncbi:MAG: NERD domain-containing protein [Aigarchaeota archaeon]|nr:NERD domain-containing protein [Aigarchaeota archaeon]
MNSGREMSDTTPRSVGHDDELSITPRVEARVLKGLVTAMERGLPLDERTVAEQAGVATEVAGATLRSWGVGTAALKDEELLGLVEGLLLKSAGSDRLLEGLRWELFERAVGRMLGRAGLEVLWDVRLNIEPTRYQFDLLAVGGGAVYAVECKRWRRTITPSLMRTVSGELLRKLEALERALLHLLGQGRARVLLVPLVIAPYVPPTMGDVYFASVRHLRSFLAEPAAALESPPVRELRLTSPPSAMTFRRAPFRSLKSRP